MSADIVSIGGGAKQILTEIANQEELDHVCGFVVYKDGEIATFWSRDIKPTDLAYGSKILNIKIDQIL